MAQEYKTLAQVTPTAQVLTNLFVTSASSQAVIGTITVSGLTEPPGTNSSFSLVVRPINEAIEDKHYIFRGSPVIAGDILVVSGAITMGPNTILAANNYTGNAHFTVYGVEIT
jgi:hypothetical protein